MIIVDRALEQREQEGRPIRVAIVGAGYIGRGVVLQIEQHQLGMECAVLYNRTLSKAIEAFEQVGIEAAHAETPEEADRLIAQGKRVVTDDPSVACRAEQVDAVLEATGHVSFAADVTLDAIDHGKHVILQNAELDATLGPILNEKARRAGLVFTNADGDQPGCTLNLFRWVKSIGCRPLLAGNLKGILDPYRTPETQAAYAATYGLTPEMATNFADGTKLAFEMAIIGNAVGFAPLPGGMRGPEAEFATDALDLFDVEELLESGGCIDYLLGAEPGPGVFVLGYDDHPERMYYMSHYKMGDGPLFCFYRPYHLPHLEATLSVARAVDFDDATVAPIGAPVCDVISLAKKDLQVGDIVDGFGGFAAYGIVKEAAEANRGQHLPIGLSDGCRVVRPVAKDQPITYADVEVPEGRVVDRLRAEQDAAFSATTA